mmetsp:Transcript_38921/g.85387  ORF Transcript_38921/g.85387 Transcript_38921/m.85387 type:complete len:179 (+) Transcript_38921:195-731(+)
MDVLKTILEAILSVVGDNDIPAPAQRQFSSTKDLSERDSTIVDMLNSAGHENVSFCVCDPHLKDCPIVFASDGFCGFTGYSCAEIEGRNCRFLQGPGTDEGDVDRIRDAIKGEKEASVNLLNYKKDGTSFNNQFFLSPLYEKDGKLAYYIGVQCSVKKLGPGQAPENPGWVYAQGLHA